MTKERLREDTTVELVGIAQKATPYKYIFRSLGILSVEALTSFFNSIQATKIRMNKEQFNKEVQDIKEAFTLGNESMDPVDLGFDIPEPEDIGFDIVEMYEGAHADELEGLLITGDENIAAYDGGTTVYVAKKEADGLVVVYDTKDLFLVAVDEMRMRFANAVAVPEGRPVTTGHLTNCIISLTSLLGFGYDVHASPPNVVVQSRGGRFAAFSTEEAVLAVRNILQWDIEFSGNPDWVFEKLVEISNKLSNKKLN